MAALVSVVTPVFNGSEYLEECVESVLAQTYDNWTYAIVDNASTDATADIAARYARRDSRIRHLRFEEHVDATANHNRAFDAAAVESEFCKPVQADDWLFPECLERMVAAAGVSDSVGVVGAYQLVETSVDLSGLPYTTTFSSGREILRGSLLGRYNVTGPPTATMLRTAFLRERRPFWDERLRHDDEEAMFWMLSRHDFAFVHQVLTFCRRQGNSRWEWSYRMNSHGGENIVFLLRYGPTVLDEGEYRSRLRARLHDYVWWHLRQLARPSRLTDREFFALHEEKRQQILDEANGDREVVAAMRLVGAVLLRRRLAPARAR